MNTPGMSIIKSRDGYSLMNTMLGMAAMSVLGVAVVTMMNDGIRGSKTVEMGKEVSQLERELIGVLANPATCINNFAGDSAINSTHASLQGPGGAGAQIYPSGSASRYGDTQYTVNSYQISNAGLGNTAALTAGGTGITNLIITVERNPTNAGGNVQKRVVGPNSVAKSIRLRVTTAAGGGIANCHATAELDDIIWARNPGSLTQIFYMGNVAIGAQNSPSAPAESLYVSGSIQAGGAGDIRSQGQGFFARGIDTNDRILLSTGDVIANNGSFISLTGGLTVTDDIQTSGGDIQVPAGSVTALNNIETTGGDLVAQGMLSVRGNGSIGATDLWATSAHGQFAQVTGSIGVSGDYLLAGSAASGSCNAATVGMIRGGSRFQVCDARPISGTNFYGYKIADSDPPCVEGGYSISPECGSGNFMRGLRGCRLSPAGVRECKPECCQDGSQGY